MKNLITTLLFSTLFLTGFSQNEDRFSVFVMTGIETFEDCKEIEKEFRKMPGITMARAGFHTKRFHVIYTADSDFDQEKFTGIFKEMGYGVKCYHTGRQGIDPFIPVSEDSCKQ